MQDVVTRIKMTLKIPECAEFFNVVLINAMGYKSNISKDTVDRAIDCVIDKNKLEIDKSNLNKNEKEQQKQNCEAICHLAKNWMLDRLKIWGSLSSKSNITRYNIFGKKYESINRIALE